MLLVQEHIDGIPATDLAAVEAAGLDRKLLAARGVDAFLRMILIDGFFHADPHPGNVFYLPGNRIVDHRLRHGRAALAAAARAGHRPARRASRAWTEEPMLDVLLDWAGDAYVDEAKLAADVNDWCSTTKACR